MGVATTGVLYVVKRRGTEAMTMGDSLAAPTNVLEGVWGRMVHGGLVIFASGLMHCEKGSNGVHGR